MINDTNRLTESIVRIPLMQVIQYLSLSEEYGLSYSSKGDNFPGDYIALIDHDDVWLDRWQLYCPNAKMNHVYVVGIIKN